MLVVEVVKKSCSIGPVFTLLVPKKGFCIAIEYDIMLSQSVELCRIKAEDKYRFIDNLLK
jgi:hypothetical protein